jgi:tetratricopeptide (TPR) repeat protein
MEKRIVLLLYVSCCFLQNDCTSAESFVRYFWAQYQSCKKEIKAADIWFTKLFQHSVPFSTYEGYLRFLYTQKRYDVIYAMKDFILHNLSSNTSALLVLSDVLSLKKEDNVVLPFLYQVHEKQPNHPELTLKLVTHCIAGKEFEKALTLIDSFLNKTSRSPQLFLFYFLKAQVCVQLERIEEAIELANHVIEMFPYFDQAKIFLGMLYEQLGHTDQTCLIYTTYLQEQSNIVPMMQYMMMQALHNYQQLQNLLKQNSSLKEKLLLQAKNAYAEQKYPEAMRIISALLPADPENKEIQLLKLSLLQKQKLYKIACSALGDYIVKNQPIDSKSPYNEILYSFSQDSYCIEHLTNIYSFLSESSLDISVLAHCADYFFHVKDAKKALLPLEKLLVDPQLSPAMFEKTATMLSSMYQICNESEKLTPLITQAMEKGCRSLPFLNNAAYFYATKGNDIPKAFQLITTVIASSKKQPYLDTYAFVLYKKNEKDAAKYVWHQLMAKNVDDPYIVFHYANASYRDNKTLAEQLLASLDLKKLPLYLEQKVAKLSKKLKEN